MTSFQYNSFVHIPTVRRVLVLVLGPHDLANRWQIMGSGAEVQRLRIEFQVFVGEPWDFL